MGGCSIRKKAVPTNFSIVLRVDRPRFARLPRFDPGFLARIDRWRLPTSGARDRPTLPNVVSRQRRNQRTTIHEPLAAQHQHGSEQQGEGGRGDLRRHLLAPYAEPIAASTRHAYTAATPNPTILASRLPSMRILRFRVSLIQNAEMASLFRLGTSGNLLCWFGDRPISA